MTETEAALRVCRRCVVRTECLEYALDENLVGTWGGTTTRQRVRLAEELQIPYLLGGEIEVEWEILDPQQVPEPRQSLLGGEIEVVWEILD